MVWRGEEKDHVEEWEEWNNLILQIWVWNNVWEVKDEGDRVNGRGRRGRKRTKEEEGRE